MSTFEAFFKTNKQIMTYARANTHYNADGQATISRDDEWFHDDVWGKDVMGVSQPLPLIEKGVCKSEYPAPHFR